MKGIVDFIRAEYFFNNDDYKFTRFEYLGWNEVMEIFDTNKINLSIVKKEELLRWFKVKQKELLNLQNNIDAINNVIDKEVYKFYNLTQEEIKIVENS